MPNLNAIIAQNVVESLPVGLLIVDQTGAFVTVNPAAAAILGFTRGQLLGSGWGQLFFENEANHDFNQIFMDVIQKELVGLCREVPYVTPAGTSRLLSITSSYLHDEATTAGVVVILHDITELSRMQRRETEILREINKIQDEKIRGLSRLAASVAHQLRNPAFAIGGFATRLARQIREHGFESEYPEIILEEARRLEAIVATVGRFASLGALRLEERPLAAIVDEARRGAEARAASLSRIIAWTVDVPEVPLVADGRLLASALGELLRNSLECARRETVGITVTATVTATDVRLVVADDGPGIAPGDRPHVFDPFYSSRPEKAGMGLALVQEILLEHNGHVALDESPGPGTAFVLTFPRFPSHLVSRIEERPGP